LQTKNFSKGDLNFNRLLDVIRTPCLVAASKDKKIDLTTSVLALHWPAWKD